MNLKGELIEFFKPTVVKIVLTILIGFIAFETMPYHDFGGGPIPECGDIYDIKPPLFPIIATYNSLLGSGCILGLGCGIHLKSLLLISIPYWYFLSCLFVYIGKKGGSYILKNSNILHRG